MRAVGLISKIKGVNTKPSTDVIVKHTTFLEDSSSAASLELLSNSSPVTSCGFNSRDSSEQSEVSFAKDCGECSPASTEATMLGQAHTSSTESVFVSADGARLGYSPASETTAHVCVFDPDSLKDGSLVVKNTFLEYQNPAITLRRCRSLPADLPEPPSDDDSLSQSESKTQDRTGSNLSSDLPCSSEDVEEPVGKVDEGSVKVLSSASDKKPLAAAPRADPKARTTIMLRHLPNNYTQQMFLAMLDEEGFAGLYDFVYLPVDFRTRAGLGYAFVNLTDPEAVPRFWEVFEGYTNWDLPTQKVCELSWSTPLQGLTAHIERFRNHSVMHPMVPENFRPMVFEKGVRIPFPPPTKSIKAPFAKKLCM